MPLPSLHPSLPANPTIGQQAAPAPAPGYSRSGGSYQAQSPAPTSGGVNREVLKGLQDVVWSDDEDDPDCLLCAEPLDLSDQNFKPCQCGLQICQFCYNKLLQTDARCPGCRRPYDSKNVIFQPVDFEEVKRAKEKKTRKAKTIKQLDAIGRRHLLGVRVVMKNMVYVVGMKLPAPGDEGISILRTNDYFGQYGKISKLYIKDRNTLTTNIATLTPDDPSSSSGIHIVYVRREDAARAISSLDGIPAPQGAPGRVLRASYGTTRYCEAFLKGVKCDNSSCVNAHEWGGESDCFTKDDMETALTRPAEYDARLKQVQVPPPSLASKTAWPKPATETVSDAPALPTTAGWAKNVAGRASTRSPVNGSRSTKIGNLVPLKTNSAFPLPTPSPSFPPIGTKEKKEKRVSSSAAAMARGRSTDSTQSTAPSSVHPSPKKKVLNLPTAITKLTPVPVTLSSSEGIAPAAQPSEAEVQIHSQEEMEAETEAEAEAATTDEPSEESLSTESEAGPSTSSPAPQTPTNISEPPLPPPLTDDPYCLHSPYEEPKVFPFPLQDPDFAFHLGLDPSDVERSLRNGGAYEPSPFDRTLVNLVELGILSPELPEIGIPPFRRASTMPFQPFDFNENVNVNVNLEEDLQSNNHHHNSRAGPSKMHLASPSRQPQLEEEEILGPRTTSRFDFARRNSLANTNTHSSSRGHSPFSAIRQTAAAHLLGIGLGSEIPHANAAGSANGYSRPGSTSTFDEAQSLKAQYRYAAMAENNTAFGAGAGAGAGDVWGEGMRHGGVAAAFDRRRGDVDPAIYGQRNLFPSEQEDAFQQQHQQQHGSHPQHLFSPPPHQQLYNDARLYQQQQQQQQQQQRTQSPANSTGQQTYRRY